MRAEILEIFLYSSYSLVELGAGTDVCTAPLRLCRGESNRAIGIELRINKLVQIILISVIQGKVKRSELLSY